MKRTFLAGAATILVLSSSAAFAQAAAQPAEAQAADTAAAPESHDGDIVVTATRSSTLLSKTPITMTAVTSETLRNAGITDARSLASAVPSLSINENGDAVRISIRGVTSTDTTEKGDPSAAFLLDGIYIARPADVIGSFYDIERVEVLRGPQGTLYGRNTTAGVINVISNRPTDKFGAKFDGSYGNLDSIDVTGMVNVPVSEGLGVRAAVNYQRQNPYYLLNGASAVPLNPYRDVLSGRLSFGGRIGNDFTFVVRGDYNNTRGTGVGGNVVTLDRFYTGTGIARTDPIYVEKPSIFERTLTVAPTFPNRRNNKNYGISGEMTYDFGPVQLTYVGAYRKTDRADTRNLLLFGALNSTAFFNGKFKQDSHELRLAFGKGSPLHGQIGGYYFHEQSFLEFNLGPPLSGFVVPGAVGFAFPQGPTVARSKAAFGQVTYDVTPSLHITGGIRYNVDDKSRNGATVVDFTNVASMPTGFVCANKSTLASGNIRCVLNQNVAARTFKKTIYKGGIDYDVPGLGLIYASVSTGYKAGGFNDGCVTGAGLGCTLTPAALYYNPETLTDYEAGIKFRISSAFRLNAAIFHYNYNSLQVSQIVTVPVPATLVTNAAKAKVDGFELEAYLQPSPNDRVELGYTYTNARYTGFVPDSTTPNFTFNGKALDHAPKHVATAGYTHTIPLNSGAKFDLAAHTRLSSAYYMIDLNNLSQFRQPSHTKTDLTATYTAADNRYYVQGFVKNVENSITIAGASTGLAASVTIEAPRTYGVRAGVKF